MVTAVFYLLTLYQLKAKNSGTKKYNLCFGNISGDFPANIMKRNSIKQVCVWVVCWL